MSKKNDVTLKISADTEKAAKGIDKVTAQLNKMQKSATSKLSSFAKLGSAISGVATSVSVVTKAFKGITAAISEANEVYNVQKNAERQLAQAAENNPYLNSTSVKNLKAYASELQNISKYGDEQLLPMMSQLAATGRNEIEIQKIMSAALDLSAGSGMSLDNAVQSLNKTLNGNIGLLGRQIPGLNNLTKADLENGKAIDIIKQKYNGLADTVTTTGEKAKNAKGDFKEALGAFSAPTIDGWNKFLTNWYQLATTKINQFSDFIDEAKTRRWALDFAMDFSKLYKEIEKNEGEIPAMSNARKNARLLNDTELQGLNKLFSTTNQKLTNGQQALYDAVKHEIEVREKHQNGLEELGKRQAEALENDNKVISENQKVQDALDAYNKTIADWQINIQARKNSGEVITEEAQAQEELNTKIAAYIEYYKTVGEMGKTAGQGILDDIKNLSASVDASSFLSTYGSKDSKSEVETLKETIAQLDTEYQALIENTELTEEQKYAIREAWAKKTEDLYQKIAEAEKKSTAETVQAIMESVTSSLTSLSDTMNTIADLNTKNAENHATVETAALEKQYAAGALSLEEYEKEKENIEKKAAKKQYKMQLAQWGVQLATATANIAQGATKALAEGGVMGTVQAALVTMSGAAQLATIIANKPVPPSFATGGIVPGTSYSGDNVQANVNSGEMILNAAQQKQLWALANGRQNNTGVGLNVNIKNYMGDSASVTSNMTPDGLEIVVNKIVEKNLSNGNYRESLIQANNNMNGDVYVS